MLPKIKIPKSTGGFLGAAKTSTRARAPYREIKRKPEMYSCGKDSYFATPDNEEAIKKCPKGIKR